MRRSVRDQLAAEAAAATAETPSAETIWTLKKRRMTNDEVIERLATAPDDRRVPGRTLLKDHSWDGRDVPGRGSAAQRRLRQMAKGQHPEAR